MTLTDNAADVGRHKFEIAGLGKAPFSFAGYSENVIRYPDGSSKAGGTCDYCGTGILAEFHILSADGKRSKVGCNCIEKVGDAGIIRAYKSSPEFRVKLREKKERERRETIAELKALIAQYRDTMAALPHPKGFTDRATGKALTFLDQVEWMAKNAGHSGRKSTVEFIRRVVGMS